MPSKRIIARLDIKSDYVVKGLQFEGLRKVGDPRQLITKYCEDGADEILLNDVVASLYVRNNFFEIIKYVVENLRVPLTVMGGIKSVDHAKRLFDTGADKIGINSHGFVDPKIYMKIAEIYGSQAIILSIEGKKLGPVDAYECMTESGRNRTHTNISQRLDFFKNSGAGELFITSVDNDGMQSGPDLQLIKLISKEQKHPLIYGGGIRNYQDVLCVFEEGFDACVIGSSLHYSKVSIQEIKSQLFSSEFEVRN